MNAPLLTRWQRNSKKGNDVFSHLTCRFNSESAVTKCQILHVELWLASRCLSKSHPGWSVMIFLRRFVFRNPTSFDLIPRTCWTPFAMSTDKVTITRGEYEYVCVHFLLINFSYLLAPSYDGNGSWIMSLSQDPRSFTGWITLALSMPTYVPRSALRLWLRNVVQTSEDGELRIKVAAEEPWTDLVSFSLLRTLPSF